MSQKTRKITITLIAIVILGLTISACGPSEPEVDVDAQKTGFAQTAAVQSTMTAEAQPTATQTPEPTATFTATPELTPTPDVTATQASPATATPRSSGADAAAWLANDPPDNTDFSPGEEFTVTWTLENVGTSTWTMDYYIEFQTGAQMDAVEQVFLPYPVPPGTNVQISVDFVAPESEGEKRSDWSLVNENDFAFYDFYVIIDVVEGSGGGGGEPAEPTNTPVPTATETSP